ncbi:MAG: Nif3-like dinuclear metal center hexameric protein [Candidatus Electrothrix sp. GW3-4]|uniref:Nif3-like dinuclear metal center hexameric protein n=1 Tax=Candidatus Electrothrix sp. GW3-4 TaxID=3126740 RepID=UPI0030D61688
MVKVQNILDILQGIAPLDLAQSWDNVGLLVGNPDSRVTSILLALDPTTSLLAEAERCQAELIITHHPAIFHPLKSLRSDRPTEKFSHAAVQAGIHVIGCHTNLDATSGGVNDVLAQLLHLQETTPLLPDGREYCGKKTGLGRIGMLAEPISSEHFLEQLDAVLSPPWLLEAGSRPAKVAQVAVCGGSCSDVAATALAAGADVFLTSEIKHDVARWAEEAGLWLLDGGHFATEYPAMEGLRQLLVARMETAGLEVQVQCAQQEPPLRLAAGKSR